MVKLSYNDFTDKYDALFRGLFYSDEFDRYIYFFDKLISVNQVPVDGWYEETNDIISFISKLVEQPTKASEFYCLQGCDYMFDFYCRFHVLIEYLIDVGSVNVSSLEQQSLFNELLTKTWLLGIPTFNHKHF